MEVVNIESFQNQISVFEDEVASFASIFAEFQSVAVPLLECDWLDRAEVKRSRGRVK
jgi:hypothetical protein